MQNVDVQIPKQLLTTEALLQLLSYLRMKNGLNDVCYVNFGVGECERGLDLLFGIDSCLQPCS